MITISLSDPKVVENFKAAIELRNTGMFSDEEIQRMYDEQIQRDAEKETMGGEGTAKTAEEPEWKQRMMQTFLGGR